MCYEALRVLQTHLDGSDFFAGGPASDKTHGRVLHSPTLCECLSPKASAMTAYYLGNLCAALVTVGLLVGTLRFTRRVS